MGVYVCTCIVWLDAPRRCDKNDPYVLCVATHTDAATLLTCIVLLDAHRRCNKNDPHCIVCFDTQRRCDKNCFFVLMHSICVHTALSFISLPHCFFVLCVLLHTDAATQWKYTATVYIYSGSTAVYSCIYIHIQWIYTVYIHRGNTLPLCTHTVDIHCNLVPALLLCLVCLVAHRCCDKRVIHSHVFCVSMHTDTATRIAHISSSSRLLSRPPHTHTYCHFYHPQIHHCYPTFHFQDTPPPF